MTTSECDRRKLTHRINKRTAQTKNVTNPIPALNFHAFLKSHQCFFEKFLNIKKFSWSDTKKPKNFQPQSVFISKPWTDFTNESSKIYLTLCVTSGDLATSFLKSWHQERHFDIQFSHFQWTPKFDPKWAQIWNLTPNQNF